MSNRMPMPIDYEELKGKLEIDEAWKERCLGYANSLIDYANEVIENLNSGELEKIITASANIVTVNEFFAVMHKTNGITSSTALTLEKFGIGNLQESLKYEAPKHFIFK